MSFQSDYPDLSAAACRQIDFIFPQGSQSRLPDGSLPLDRIAVLGYRGLCEAIATSPVETRRTTGEFDILSNEASEAEKIAGEISAWLVGKGLRVEGWPRPPTQYNLVHPFLSLPERIKAKSIAEVIGTGKRQLTEHEKQWLLMVLKSITDTLTYPSSSSRQR